MADVEFTEGIYVNAPNDNAPDFVKARIRIDMAQAYKWLVKKAESVEKDESGKQWLNLDVKEGKNGRWYASVDNWKPSGKRSSDPFGDEDAPF
tara:strand:+ start:124 stop:402 length:279 start_codon:yes stop_codon:yes gene_type:complete